MGWLERTGGILVAPRQTFRRILKGQEGRFSDVLLLMFVMMLGTLPVQTARIVLAGFEQGAGGTLGKLLYLYVHFSALPLVVCVATALVLVGMERVRGTKVLLETVMVTSTYLWVPLGAMGLLGALLHTVGLELWFLPHIPLDLFLRLDPPWWMYPLRILLSYGWSIMLVPVLVSELRAAKPEQLPAIPKRASWVLIILILVTYVSGGAQIAVQYEDIRPRRIGDRAPGFILPRVDGQGQLSLAGLSGKPVVLDFWATWCAQCVKGMPKLVTFAKAHPEVRVLAIHLGGDSAEVQAMIRDNKWTVVTYLLDETSQTSLLYQADTLPKYVVVNPTGQITAYRYGIPPSEWLEKAIE